MEVCVAGHYGYICNEDILFNDLATRREMGAVVCSELGYDITGNTCRVGYCILLASIDNLFLFP